MVKSGIHLKNKIENKEGMSIKKEDVGRESVKLARGLVNRVRKNKEKNGVPINTFIENATARELDKIDLRDSEKVGGKK